MAKKSDRVSGQVGVQIEFEVVHMEVTQKDAQKAGLSEGQSLHLFDAASEGLKVFGNPNAYMGLYIEEPIGDLLSFIEKGGLLGKTTMRGFFGVFPSRCEIVVAGYEKVQREGGPRPHVIQKMQNRLHYYQMSLAC